MPINEGQNDDLLVPGPSNLRNSPNNASPENNAPTEPTHVRRQKTRRHAQEESESIVNETIDGHPNVAAYILGVPIALPLPCRFCPGRKYYTHAALSKHLKRDHTPQNTWYLAFRCNGCKKMFTELKACNYHRKKTNCFNAGQEPENRPEVQHMPVDCFRPVRTRAPRLQGSVPLDQPTAMARIASTLSPVGARTDHVQFRRETDHRPGALAAEEHNNSPRSFAVQTASPASSTHSLRSNHHQPTTPIAERHQPQTTEAVQHQPTAQQREWLTRFNSAATATELELLFSELITNVKQQAEKAQNQQRQTQRPQLRRQVPPNQHGRRRNPMNADHGPAFNPQAAARIQRLYRQCRVRAYREVTEQQSPFCQLPPNVLQEHFTAVFGPSQPVDDTMPAAVPQLSPVANNNPFTTPFTNNETWSRLRFCSSTAPGPDGIRYAVWKRFDPYAHILTAVFNAVQRLRHIPNDWRRSTTVLIHKKGPRDDVTNWRPIALSDTIGKLHSSVLANRLSLWSVRNNRISSAQKGFMPVDGCAEHNFELQSALQDARRDKKQCAVAWLDLTNAFGSVPHAAIFRALRWAGLNEAAVDVIRLLYTDNITSIRHSAGLTDAITVHAGVKQGCPLSPIIFNLTIEPIIRTLLNTNIGYKFGQRKTTVLAYADDLALIADNATNLQRMLNVTDHVAEWAHLRFNARKCATLVLDGKNNRASQMQLTLQDALLPAMDIEQHYEHLGIPTGYQRALSAKQNVQRMTDHVDAIDRSLLAPWQKLDAVNTFVLPSVSFHMRNGEVRKGPLLTLDKKIVRAAKRWLNLPQRASTEQLYLRNSMGGFGLTPLNQLADISQLVHGIRLLTSRDMAATAVELLRAVVQKRLRRPPQQHELAQYLNGSMDGDMRNETTDISNTWTRLRTATRRLHNKVNVSWHDNGEQLELRLNDTKLQPKAAEYCLRSAVRDYHHQRLLAKPDQGKVHSVTSINSASSHFIAGGNFTRFADWRFIHRARLDCVPLNGTRRFGQVVDKRCRRCGHANETLPHVLCHCPPMMATIGRRHNTILDRLTRAFRPPATTDVRINSTVPGFYNNIRPDIVALDNSNNTALIIDVCMPFENRYAAFEAARETKRHKYDDLAQHLRQQGMTVFLDAFIVGPLGGWDPHNEHVLNRMAIGHHYRQLMRKLMVSDAIKWSRDIYVEHITGTKQYNDWPTDNNREQNEEGHERTGQSDNNGEPNRSD